MPGVGGRITLAVGFANMRLVRGRGSQLAVLFITVLLHLAIGYTLIHGASTLARIKGRSARGSFSLVIVAIVVGAVCGQVFRSIYPFGYDTTILLTAAALSAVAVSVGLVGVAMELYECQFKQAAIVAGIYIFISPVASALNTELLVGSYKIPTESMLPTLAVGDFVLVRHVGSDGRFAGLRGWGYPLTSPHRGDLMAFTLNGDEPGLPPPMTAPPPYLKGLPPPTKGPKTHIKRCIAIPGDRLEVNHGYVKLNGVDLAEPYVKRNRKTWGVAPTPVVIERIPDGHFFMLGDNRDASLDSRMYGCIPIEKIVGRVSCCYWPLSRLSEF